MTKKLPIVGSTAASTAFCSARIDGPEGTYLFVDGNGKVTRDNGTLHDPKPNAFSLVQIVTCPGSTEACRSACYVHNLETAQGAVHDLYKHNTTEIKRILADANLSDWWVMAMANWINLNASGGFRWHVSGDVFSPEYARWIADVCFESATVSHWIYTRSFGDDYLGALTKVSTLRGGNLAINLSCDRDNYEQAEKAAEKHGTPDMPLRLCYLTLDGTVPRNVDGSSRMLEGDVIFPDYNLRPRQFATLAEAPWWKTLRSDEKQMVCPVDAHGKAENRRCGPCDRCLT